MLAACTSSGSVKESSTPIVFVLSTNQSSPSSSPRMPVPELDIRLSNSANLTSASCQQLGKLIPTKTSITDIYKLIGLPNYTRKFPNGVTIQYQSKNSKFPHVILINQITGQISFVAISNRSDNCFALESLKAQYGEPTIACTSYSDGGKYQADFLFFARGGIAADVATIDNHIDYVQLLPSNMTIAEYQDNDCFQTQMFAFSP